MKNAGTIAQARKYIAVVREVFGADAARDVARAYNGALVWAFDTRIVRGRRPALPAGAKRPE